MSLVLGERIRERDARNWIFSKTRTECNLDPGMRARIEGSHQVFLKHLETGVPIYGVNTGFGANSNGGISPPLMERLQDNLVSYLLCGTGELLPLEVSRGIFLARVVSLSRGYSGVSYQLLEAMLQFIKRDWIPAIPRNGSLGASGDLVPLAYIADVLRGGGQVHVGGKLVATSEVHAKQGVPAYQFKPKEALALVNGTSAMVGSSLYLLQIWENLLELCVTFTSWTTLVLHGDTDSFSTLVNESAKRHRGQSLIAKTLRSYLETEDQDHLDFRKTLNFQSGPALQHAVQDRYSLRCVPQILGPVFDTLELCRTWFETELNGVSDNPLVDWRGEIRTGGNFYGGYIGHGIDYLRMNWGQLADLMDRQMMLLFDSKTNMGLPSNLVAVEHMSSLEASASHGLKGLHQSMSAIASQVLAQSNPVTIHSRSSESHNQDKVSLGMSSCTLSVDLISPMYQMAALQGIALAQALDLRGIQLHGAHHQELYSMIREVCPMVTKDQRLDYPLAALEKKLLGNALFKEEAFYEAYL